MEMYGLMNLDSGFKFYIIDFIITMKLRTLWALWFDSERLIVYQTNHNKVQDTTNYHCSLLFSSHALLAFFATQSQGPKSSIVIKKHCLVYSSPSAFDSSPTI